MPVIFVLILMLVAGLVAAGGDRMGHRAARAKIRIGKLRPRTASTIIAVITGVLISLVTFGVVFAVWRDFREALLRYDEVKSRVGALQAEVAESTTLREQAVAEKARAEEDLQQAQVQMIEVTRAMAQAEDELEAAEVKVASSERELKELNAKRAALQKDIDNYKARLDDVRALVEKARSDVTAYQEGEVVMAKGTRLYYLPLDAGEAGNLAGKLEITLAHLGENLAADGLKLDPASAQAAQEFASNFTPAGGRSLIVISAARNAVAGEGVLLDFSAQQLKTLVAKGDLIMEVLVGTDNARVRMKGLGERSLAVPAQFDTDSLVDFSVALYGVFSEGAQALGFLPDLRSGEIATPVESLTSIADDLVGRPRPFIIQFVAKQDAAALDGLAAAEIYISNPPTAPQP